MNKPWSITTTMRNPYRIRDCLKVLQSMEGEKWNSSAQIEFQLKLIQNRYYGYGESQFYNGLPPELVKLIDDSSHEITHAEVKAIFHRKNYEDPPMRGRQSFNVLKKFGFVLIPNQRIKITDAGQRFLSDHYDLRDIFLRIFLKWQIPSPYYNRQPFNSNSYDIKPFVGVLHLIRRTNAIEKNLGKSPKGLSKEEFCVFAPTLINYRDIETIAQTIVNYREEKAGKSQQEKHNLWLSQRKQYATEFLRTSDSNKIEKLLRNLADYGDNAIRYFRLTGYIHIRGNGFFVDLEPRRAIEIDALLESDNAAAQSFKSEQEFVGYISDSSQPSLPWETKNRQVEIINQIQREVNKYEKKLNLSPSEIIDPNQLNKEKRAEVIVQLIDRRRDLLDIDRYNSAQSEEAIQETIEILNNIRRYEQKAILLEKTAALCLCALNDSLGIYPQYPVGDDNEPTFTAPANTPDIECFYVSFNAICEVTMLTDRKQWYYEGQPVMRHLRDFENKHPHKPTYCLFVAPNLHRDTINTFWASIKFGYEGHTQRIIPLTLAQLSDVMNTLLKLKRNDSIFAHNSLQRLFDDILRLSNSLNDSSKWIVEIPDAIDFWEEEVLL